MTYGLIEELQELTAYVLGRSNVPYIEYNDSGDWTDSLPRYEPQADRFETNGCAVFGTQNQIETLHRFLYSTEPNYSERFNYLLAGVDPDRGIDPQRVYECIRKSGVIDQALMPMTDSRADFLDRSDLKGSLLARGLNWLERHDFQHEWLWVNRPADALDILKAALKTSPIAVSMTTGYQRDGLYVDNGRPNTHWCLCYKVDAQGIHVFDSYTHERKVLALDHTISRAKRIWLNKKTKQGARRQIGFIQAFINKLMQKQTILDVCEQYLGTDPTPNGVDNEVACVDSGTTIMRKVWDYVPHEVSTIVINRWLADPANGFVRIDAPEPGAIVLSPTEGQRIGHMGFVMRDGTIASNTSFGPHKGRFIKNYTPTTWNRRYRDGLSLDVYYYRKV